MKKAVLLICLMVALMLIPTHSQAQTHEQVITFRPFYLLFLQPDEETNILSSAFLDAINDVNGINNDSWPHKLGFGALNTITSWTEIPKEVVTVSGEQNLVAGFTFNGTRISSQEPGAGIKDSSS